MICLSLCLSVCALLFLSFLLCHFLVVNHDSIRGFVRPSVGPSVMLLSAGKDEPASDLFRVYELVKSMLSEVSRTIESHDETAVFS